MGEYLLVKGGSELWGKHILHSAKNAVLPLLALSIMTDDEVIIDDCPYISDIDSMLNILSTLGKNVVKNARKIVVSGMINTSSVDRRYYKTMRSSMYMLGALLARTKEVEVYMPGGCSIGARPLDIHIDGLKRLGVDIVEDGDRLICRADGLRGADIVMKFPSVGATQNLMMCACLSKGKTTLINCAREPEIISLANALRIMGASVRGDGTSVIHVDGVKKLDGFRIKPVTDRIVNGTLICATALTGGDVTIEGANIHHVMPLKYALTSKYCKIEGDENYVRVRSLGRPKCVDIITAPYPLFPTDLQPQVLSVACFADGVSCIKEGVFENRFAHAYELKKLGMDINIANQNTAYVCGKHCEDFDKNIVDCRDLYAKDLRGGAGLLLALLNIRGEHRLHNVHYMDRGYEHIEDTFLSLGGWVARKCE